MYRKMDLMWEWMCFSPGTRIAAVITVITHDKYMAFRESLQDDDVRFLVRDPAKEPSR
jgi:hypothetical protein